MAECPRAYAALPELGPRSPYANRDCVKASFRLHEAHRRGRARTGPRSVSRTRRTFSSSWPRSAMPASRARPHDSQRRATTERQLSLGEARYVLALAESLPRSPDSIALLLRGTAVRTVRRPTVLTSRLGRGTHGWLLSRNRISQTFARARGGPTHNVGPCQTRLRRASGTPSHMHGSTRRAQKTGRRCRAAPPARARGIRRWM